MSEPAHGREPRIQPGIRCLIVDDREDNILVLSALLRQEGVELLTAQSGPEALELLLVHDIALALLDVAMPEMDGFELAELMRGSERTRQVPIIFVTAGMHQQQLTFKGYESGAVDFLHKPIDAHILRSKAGVFFDLHRQKQQLARELHERTEALRLNEMFTAVLGHDLRNPLNAMLAYARVLEISSTEPTVVEAAARLVASGKRMSRMIEDLVDLSRARVAGGIRIERGPADLAHLVQRVVEEHRAAAPSCRIEVRLQGDPAGEWDAGRLAQLISNLIGNALQHGRSNTSIDVHLDGKNVGHVALSISNAGAVPHELVPHVFDPFRSGDRQVSRTGGLGLGLYIVKQIAAAHGGTVELDATDPNSTTFRVRLPRRSHRSEARAESLADARPLGENRVQRFDAV